MLCQEFDTRAKARRAPCSMHLNNSSVATAAVAAAAAAAAAAATPVPYTRLSRVESFDVSKFREGFVAMGFTGDIVHTVELTVAVDPDPSYWTRSNRCLR